MVKFEQDVNDSSKFLYCTLSLIILVGDDMIDGDTIPFSFQTYSLSQGLVEQVVITQEREREREQELLD